jgi:hypothetical protein
MRHTARRPLLIPNKNNNVLMGVIIFVWIIISWPGRRFANVTFSDDEIDYEVSEVRVLLDEVEEVILGNSI